MLSVTDLTYKIGARTILDECSVTIMDNWKVGVVGLNGAGKSTLFKLISGDLMPDGGIVEKNAKQRMGMVRQDIPEVETSLLDLVLEADEEMAALWKATETEEDPNKIAEIYEKLADIDAYSAPAKASRLLTGLGFSEDQLSEPFSSFSGGWRMRVALAAALFVEPEILLLDEPTNHLDLEAIMWLEAYLASYPHTLLIISHDREVLNKCIDHVIHVDAQKLKMYTGNYDTFERERAEALGLQQKMHEKQQAERAHMQKFVDRFKAQASKASQAQSRMKALEKMDIVDAVISSRAVHFTFPNPKEIASPMISIDKADIGYTAGQPILRRVHENIDNDDRIALLGANGNGKSTLIKLIADKLAPMSGEVRRSTKLRIGYFSQHQTEELDVESTPYQEMMTLMRVSNPNVTEPKVRAKLGAFGFSKELADNAIKSLSGGEKARLLFAIMSFDAPHLLLLDEPTNHLDIDAREALVQALNNYEGAIVIVSHDPNMVERVADRLWVVRDGECQHFDGDLEDYRNFTMQARREDRKKDKKKKEAKNDNAVAETPKDEPKPAVNPQAIAKLEKKIVSLEGKKSELETLMAAEGFYTKPHDEMAKVQDKHAKVVSDLEDVEAQWLELQAG
ncbi:MAG: ABC-F family ATP-binding cassette domain-containing protein [Alphaproteobacteria bacterium]|nr:ABC-F family ATP-binding cassette domain-containing protein [Alphaproteobacteria bacterium]